MPCRAPAPYDEPVTRRTLLAAALALALAGASALGGGTLYVEGPASSKMIVEYGSAGAWQRALLVWWLLGALCVAGLVVAYRRPLLGVVLAGIGAGGHLLNPRIGPLPLDLAAPITLYLLVTLGRSRRTAWIALVVMTVAAYALIATGQGLTDVTATRVSAGPGKPVYSETVDVPAVVNLGLFTDAAKSLAEPLLVLVLAFAVGVATRNRRAHLATLEARTADLEREQDQRAALATAAERARITRELHDIVAHGLSVMVVQAQGAAAAQDRHPERTAAALQAIITTGRASLGEMRRLLGVVRQDPQLAPQPGIAALPALVDQVRAAGTPVRMEIEGEPVPLPAVVDLSAYRVVQEALTNTLKHAGPGAQALVRLAFAPARVDVEVRDDGVGVPSTVDNGNGLRGIAERVGLLRGELTVESPPGGGFRVAASLPVEPDAIVVAP
jgi:signal transduction histidine kinase